jgi:RNA polymerase sigma-70 factor (ECF subfamily)
VTPDWQMILAEHGAQLWRAVYRLLGHYDDALDCCQDALLDAHRFALTRRVDEWGALLATLGTRRAIDRLREQCSRRRFTVPLQDVPEPAVETAEPVEQAKATELLQQLRHELAKLPVKQAEVFWLVCMEGFSHDEVARQLAMTPNESRVLLHRARAALETMLDADKRNARWNP